jgi:uncharacterized YccA/Bax inhibitor family protein
LGLFVAGYYNEREDPYGEGETMALMKTSNPALGMKTFSGLAVSADSMTLDGTVNKTGMCLLFVIIGASWTWTLYYRDPSSVIPWMLLGLLGGVVTGFVSIFKKTWSPVLAPAYSALEGLALGGISAQLETQYQGIVIQSVALTFGTLFSLLIAYKSGLIKASENFKRGVFAATGAIALLYLVSFVLSFFSINIGFIHSSGPTGILFSLAVVVIAALNLVLDFDFISQGVANRAPRFMEWYSAFGLIVTLVWLYLEILMLLSKTRSRR